MKTYPFLNNVSEVSSNYLRELYAWLDGMEPRRAEANKALANAKKRQKFVKSKQATAADSYWSNSTSPRNIKQLIKDDYKTAEYSQTFFESETTAIMCGIARWLVNKLPSYSRLSTDETKEESNFSFHWSSFECAVYNKQGYIQLWNTLMITYARGIEQMLISPAYYARARLRGQPVPGYRGSNYRESELRQGLSWFDSDPLMNMFGEFSNNKALAKDTLFKMFPYSTHFYHLYIAAPYIITCPKLLPKIPVSFEKMLKNKPWAQDWLYYINKP